MYVIKDQHLSLFLHFNFMWDDFKYLLQIASNAATSKTYTIL